MTILYIYGARSILILLYNYKDTEIYSPLIKIGVSGPILTQKNIKLSMGQQDPYRTRWVKTILEIIHGYGARAVFL